MTRHFKVMERGGAFEAGLGSELRFRGQWLRDMGFEPGAKVPADGDCQYEAHRLYNLWDMISFLADGLFFKLGLLENCQQSIEGRVKECGFGVCITQEEAGLIWRLIESLMPVFDALDLPDSRSRAFDLIKLAMPDVELGECSHVSALIQRFVSAVHGELESKQFAYIPPDNVQFFEQHDLFGEEVSSAFPSAQPEIQDAGNCLAADLHTAAVFHLMRAVEFGLRALAIHLKVRRILRRPLDDACWGEVIQAIDKKLKTLQGKTRGKKKTAQLESYGRLNKECDYFRNAWRNPVSHARGRNSEAGALDVLGHVRDFMQKLVQTGIRESGRGRSNRSRLDGGGTV